MMQPTACLLSRPRQAGAVLITTMIFLVVLTVLGVTSARVSGLEERMSGNMRDRMVAMQAAEMALRDAERDLQAKGTALRFGGVPVSGLEHFSPTCNFDGATSTDDDGLCDRVGGEPSVSGDSVTWPAFSKSGVTYAALTVDMTAFPSIAYGRFTGAPTISGVSAQPRYIIDGFTKRAGGDDEPVALYRITARAQGVNPNTVVWLQEVFKPR